MNEHLDEMALEALATGRDDLVSAPALAHLDECEHCAGLVGLERLAAEDASVALERIIVDLDDLDSMIAQAMTHAPDPILGAAPSRRSLTLGAGTGAIAAIGLAGLSLPGAESLSGLSAAGSQLWTLGRALDSVVESAVPGGWALLAIVGLVVSLMLVVPMRLFLGAKPLRPSPAVVSMLALGSLGMLSVPSSLAHAYRVDGPWPEPQPRVSVDVENQPTTEALRQAVRSAGLGVVVRMDVDPLVTMHVVDAPLGEVVEALLGTSDVVVRPGASLITVRPAEAPPAVPEATTPEATTRPSVPAPTPPAPAHPVPSSQVADRFTFGANLVIGPDEEVRDVVTMGGDVALAGRAYGDVVTMGGDADIDGEVIGNVLTMGGDIRVGAGSRIHGDINAMGGDLDIASDAIVHGQALSAIDTGSPGRSPHAHLDKGDLGLASVFRWALFNVMLFLFGLFLLGAYRERFSTLRAELSDRPIRSAFGGLFGGLAATLICGVLTLTIIGIPGSVVLGTMLVVGGGVGWAASAWWLGSVLPFKRLEGRPVLQLAVGLGALFVVGLVPKIGTLVVVAAVFAGLGAVIATSFGRKATAAKRGKHIPTGPFRTGAR